MRSSYLLIVALFTTSCMPGGDHRQPDADVPDTSEVDLGCSPLFYQDQLPEYRVTISEAEWDALNDEFLNRAANEEAGLNYKPYHPIELRYEGETVPNAMLRLKGQSSWWQAIAFDDNPKMQFVISFNEIDPKGRFKGVRKVELDMPRSDESFLRHRLALYSLRKAGQQAQCANNAKLYINGEYYGLYSNVERLDKEFLQRVYGDDDEGDLWKGGRDIKTNEEDFSWARLDAFWHPTGMADVETLVDLDASVKEWAAEAMIPHGDGYYNGRANFFLYDHPRNGFTWIPHDLDAAFDFISADTSPMYPECDGRNPRERLHWAMAMADPGWLEVYRTGLANARASYEPAEIQALITWWADQIAEAAADDQMKPFSTQHHLAAIETLRAYATERAATVDEWIDCWQSGGADSDGDGWEFCNDCDDGDSARNFDAPELCNGYDDNCDGQIDEPTGDQTCE